MPCSPLKGPMANTSLTGKVRRASAHSRDRYGKRGTGCVMRIYWHPQGFAERVPAPLDAGTCDCRCRADGAVAFHPATFPANRSTATAECAPGPRAGGFVTAWKRPTTSLTTSW
jgi:hypothetical protein